MTKEEKKCVQAFKQSVARVEAAQKELVLAEIEMQLCAAAVKLLLGPEKEDQS